MCEQEEPIWRRPVQGAASIELGLTDEPKFEPAGSRRTSSGSVQLWKPNDAMREVHKRLYYVIGRPYTTSFNGHNIAAREASLENMRYFYIVDFEDAFSSVTAGWFADYLFSWRGGNENRQLILGSTPAEAAATLERICFHPKGGLIQGSPSSPAIFDFFVTDKLTLQLVDWLRSEGWRIHKRRYVDDLVFMSRQPITQNDRRIIKRLIRDAGFRINERKVRGGVLRNQTIELTGVAIRRTRHGVRMFLPRRRLARLEGLLHRANKGQLVNVDQIEGLMGDFLLVTHPATMNATERRVVKAYERFTGKKARSNKMVPYNGPNPVWDIPF